MSNKKVKIGKIPCYGEMREGQNVLVIEQGENDEYPNQWIMTRGFRNWTAAVKYIVENRNVPRENIQELRAV